MKLLAITACPAGVAETYMAAEAIEMAAKKRGHQIKVETQGSDGLQNRITADDIKGVDAIILTNDISIREKERFADLFIINVPCITVITKADKVIEAVEKQVILRQEENR